MSDLPRFGQYAQTPRAEKCPKHPGVAAIGYCKRCNRPTCPDCTIPTEVGSICVDCGRASKRRRFRLGTDPIVTYIFLGLSLVVYALQWIAPVVPQLLSFNPLWAFGQPWRFVTAGFVHYGFFHLLFNMLMLVILGSAVEKAAGHWRFACLYLLSAFGGSIAVLAWGVAVPESLMIATVGASGAIYGLFGTVFVQQKRAGLSTTSILVLLGINLLYSFMNASSVSWQAHVGGLIVGGLVAWMYLALAQPKRGRSPRKHETISILATAGVTAALIGLTVALYLPIWSTVSALW